MPGCAERIALASPLICGQTQRLLATAVLTTFPHTALDALTDSTTVPVGVVEPAALRRAVAFIDAHASEDIGIAEIAQAARVGPRGLQQAFRRYRDTTPMEYLRRVRLDHAHRELLAGDPARGDIVSAIAARWGFPHAGRFSMAYHDTYGCLPSQTLPAYPPRRRALAPLNSGVSGLCSWAREVPGCCSVSPPRRRDRHRGHR